MKVVLIISGGMDSTTLLYYALSQGHEVKCLSFNYGQRHYKELTYAIKTCSNLKIPHEIIDISQLTHLLSNSVLTNHNLEMPEGHYAQENMKSTVVPNRNAIMLSIAVGYAENLKYDAVMYAAHSGDHYIYPDCRPEFGIAFDLASRLGTFNKIQLITPFMYMTKGDIAVIGKKLGIDYDKETWTCYVGKDVACGKCGACTERIEAMTHANIPVI